MFGISQADLLVILLLILILFGPKKIPGIMRSLGVGVRELKRASREATDEFHRLTAESEAPEEHPGADEHPGEKTV